MSEHLYMKLDSSQRTYYTTTNAGSFTLTVQRPLKGCWRLCQAYVPISQFNVGSTNNIIYFYENSIAKTATLTPGYYDNNSLLTEVATRLNAASGGFGTYTVTQSALPLRITIASTQPFALQFQTYTANSAANILGYLSVDTALATSQLATNISNLASLRSYNISINNESGFLDAKGRLCTFVIPVMSNTGGLAVYEPSHMFPQLIHFSQSTATLKIQVTDDNGIPIALSCDWYIVLGKC